MKRSDFLRKIAHAYENCDGDGDKLIETLVSMECVGTSRGINKELRLAADDLDRLERIDIEAKKT